MESTKITKKTEITKKQFVENRSDLLLIAVTELKSVFYLPCICQLFIKLASAYNEIILVVSLFISLHQLFCSVTFHYSNRLLKHSTISNSLKN